MATRPPAPTTPYATSSIQLLSGVEAVRRRPGMYIGDAAGPEAPLHLLREVLGNVVDLALEGRASRVAVSLEGGLCTVEDDGPGLSVAPDREGVPWATQVLTQLHSTPTRDGHSPHIHLGLRGVGLAVVNALSERLLLTTQREGVTWRQTFAAGVPTSELEPMGPTLGSGTRLAWAPDSTLLTGPALTFAALSEELWRVGCLCAPRLEIWLQGRRLPVEGGLAAWLQRAPRAWRLPPVVCNSNSSGVSAAIGWLDAASPPALEGFVSFQEVPEGLHLEGLRRVLKRAARRAGRRWEEVAPGLVGAVHLLLSEPRFGAPTRHHLTTPEAPAIIEAALLEPLTSWLASW